MVDQFVIPLLKIIIVLNATLVAVSDDRVAVALPDPPRLEVLDRSGIRVGLVGLDVPAADLAAWEARLAERDIAIVERKTWDLGGQSLYFRDPDGNLVELATPGVWTNY